jgi:hypothetical protein
VLSGLCGKKGVCDMSNRNLAILGLAAVGMVILAVAIQKISSRPYVPAKTGGYLIQGLDPDQIASITVGRGSEQVILNRLGNNFVVASRDNYPALVSEINKLITTCVDIKTSEMYTDNPANHKELGVTEEDARHLVKFFKADATLLTGVVIGNPRGKGQDGGYVRRIDDNRVYTTAAQIPWINNRATDFVERQLTDIKREDIELVTVEGPNETYMLKPGDDDKTVILENMPEGRKIKNEVANDIFTALSYMMFDDVNTESSKQELKFGWKYVCRLKDSTLYTFRLAKDGNDWFTKCDAELMDKTPIVITEGQDEPQEELKKKEAKLKARDTAKDFSKRHNGWVYQIPVYKAENMTKPLAELLEDITKQGQDELSLQQEETEEEIDFDLTQRN